MTSPTASFPIRNAGDLCRQTLAVDVDTRNRDVYEVFEDDAMIMNIPVTENGRIVGLINRDSFIRNLAGRFRQADGHFTADRRYRNAGSGSGQATARPGQTVSPIRGIHHHPGR